MHEWWLIYSAVFAAHMTAGTALVILLIGNLCLHDWQHYRRCKKAGTLGQDKPQEGGQ